MSESFEKLSVIELRKLAREKGIKLGAGINKQGIIDKLLEAADEGGQAPQEQPFQMTMQDPSAPARPIRSAAIITDDESTSRRNFCELL